MINLFRIKLTKEVPANWFTDTHKAIDEATKHSELDGLYNAIDRQLEAFNISGKDRIKLIMLRAKCNLRYHLLTESIKRENQLLRQIINN